MEMRVKRSQKLPIGDPWNSWEAEVANLPAGQPILV